MGYIILCSNQENDSKSFHLQGGKVTFLIDIHESVILVTSAILFELDNIHKHKMENTISFISILNDNNKMY